MGGVCALLLQAVFMLIIFSLSIFIRIHNNSDTFSSLFHSLQAEVDFLGNLHHPNLVRLIGYCVEDDQRLLVYEFMPRGSLDNHLFRSIYLNH